jgi:hypothetical protein
MFLFYVPPLKEELRRPFTYHSQIDGRLTLHVNDVNVYIKVAMKVPLGYCYLTTYKLNRPTPFEMGSAGSVCKLIVRSES